MELITIHGLSQPLDPHRIMLIKGAIVNYQSPLGLPPR